MLKCHRIIRLASRPDVICIPADCYMKGMRYDHWESRATDYEGGEAYAESKLANVLMVPTTNLMKATPVDCIAVELRVSQAKAISERYPALTAASVHPGLVVTPTRPVPQYP